MLHVRHAWIATASLLAAILPIDAKGAVPPATTAPAATIPPAATMFVEVYVKGDRRDQKVAGKLAAHDDVGITLDTPSGPRELKWDELTASSAFTLKSRLIDPTIAVEWLGLGRWGWEHGLEAQSRAAFSRATKLDLGLMSQANAITANPSGRVAVATATQTPTTKPAAAPSASVEQASKTPELLQPGTAGGTRKIVRYQPSTPAEDAASIALSRKRRDEAEDILKVKLAEVETAHFLIYTDWDFQEYGFLKDQCEGAYRVVAKQFDRSPKDNVFVGQAADLHVCEAGERSERSPTTSTDRACPKRCWATLCPSIEMGHMAMWKPGIGSGVDGGHRRRRDARGGRASNWGRTLVHEFSHAFIHRYQVERAHPALAQRGHRRGDRRESVLPTSNYYHLGATGRDRRRRSTCCRCSSDKNMPTGQMYPVMDDVRRVHGPARSARVSLRCSTTSRTARRPKRRCEARVQRRRRRPDQSVAAVRDGPALSSQSLATSSAPSAAIGVGRTSTRRTTRLSPSITRNVSSPMCDLVADPREPAELLGDQAADR